MIYILKINPVSAGPGVGETILSEQVVRDFYDYIQQSRTQGDGNQIKFRVTEDGENSYSWVCPYSECVLKLDHRKEDKFVLKHNFANYAASHP